MWIYLDLFRPIWCVHSNDREAIYHIFLMFCTRRPGPCCSSLLALWSPALARWNSIPMDFWCRRKMWGLGSGFEIEFLRFEMALYIYITMCVSCVWCWTVSDGVGWHSPNSCSLKYGCERVPWPYRGMHLRSDCMFLCLYFFLMFIASQTTSFLQFSSTAHLFTRSTSRVQLLLFPQPFGPWTGLLA